MREQPEVGKSRSHWQGWRDNICYQKPGAKAVGQELDPRWRISHPENIHESSRAEGEIPCLLTLSFLQSPTLPTIG